MPSHEKATDVFWLLPLEGPLTSDFPETCPSVLSGTLTGLLWVSDTFVLCVPLAPCGVPSCALNSFQLHRLLAQLLTLQSSCTSLAPSASGFKLLFWLLFMCLPSYRTVPLTPGTYRSQTRVYDPPALELQTGCKPSCGYWESTWGAVEEPLIVPGKN